MALDQLGRLPKAHGGSQPGISPRLNAVLEQAQAEATSMQDQFVSTEPAFAHVEVYVHLAQRGVSTLTTNYRLAARE